MHERIKVINIDNKKNKIKDKDELKELLKNYKTILSKAVYDYFSSLIELDIPTMKDYISNDERKVLSELEIYNEAARYNIYNRTIRLFKQEETNLGPVIIEDENGLLSIKDAVSKINLFEFNYIKNMFGETVDETKTRNIGNISIFKTELASNLSENDIALVNKKLAKVEKIINPYGPYTHHGVNKGLSYEWERNHKQDILEYKHFLNTVKAIKNITLEQKQAIQLTSYTHNMLEKEFNLSEDDYEHKEVDLENEDYRNVCVKSMDKLVLYKTLTKRMPNLIVTDKIKYI